MPASIHSGGLRYHGMAPLISHLKELGEIEAIAVGQQECFSNGLLFARTEGILPAPEATHAVTGAIIEALKCKETGEAKVIGCVISIGFGLSFDLTLTWSSFGPCPMNRLPSRFLQQKLQPVWPRVPGSPCLRQL